MLLEEELSLVAQAKEGDKAAISALYDAITPKLYGYLVNVIRDKSLAEDILQDTWVKAISSLELFRAKGVRFSAWIFAIARNECRMYWRKQKKEISLDEVHAHIPDGKDLSQRLWVDQLIQKLSVEEQELLRLRYIADLSFKEIAIVLGIPPITARVRVHRALKKANTFLSGTPSSL